MPVESQSPTITNTEPSLPATICSNNRVGLRKGWTAPFLTVAHWSSVGLFCWSLVLLGVGIVQWKGLAFPSPKDGDVGLWIGDRQKSFGSAACKQSVPISFELRNTSTRPITIVGGAPSCNIQGCITLQNLPLVIPPSESRFLMMSLATRIPGWYEAEVTVYSDYPTQLRTALTISGMITADDSKR